MFYARKVNSRMSLRLQTKERHASSCSLKIVMKRERIDTT